MDKRTQRAKSGQGLVEFTLILPLLLLFLVGILEFGRLLFIYSNLFNATREGIRYGVTNPRDFNGIRNAVADHVALAPVNPIEDPFNPEGVWVIVQYDNGPGTPKHQEVNYLTAGDRVFINVRYTIKAITPLFDPFFGADGITLDSKATRTIQTIGVIVNAPPPVPPGYGDGEGSGDGGGDGDGGGGGGGTGPTITLEPTCGPAGPQSINIYGYDWDGDTRIDAYFGDTQVAKNTAINPIFILPFNVANVQDGTYTVSVTGRQTGRTATATYTVPCSANPPTPTPTALPSATPTVTPTPVETPDVPPALAQIEIDEPVLAGQTFVAGAAQPRETVTLRIVQTGQLFSTVVGNDGRFIFGDLSPLQAGMTLIVQGYGQQDMTIVTGPPPTPEPTLEPRKGGYIEISPNCGPVGDQTSITVCG
ncbi:MAG: TadE/TadG family type IV pilus assembly protein [Anaerolineae bacterium]